MPVRTIAARLLPTAIAVACIGVFVASWLRTGEMWGVVAWSGYPVVGWYILQVRPGNRIGWVMLGIGVCWALAIASIGTSSVPLMLVGSGSAYLGFILFLVLILLFPTGNVTTTLGRLGVRLTTVVAALVVALSLVRPSFGEDDDPVPNPLAVDAVGPFASAFLDDQGFLVVVLVAAIAGVDAVRRWRRSDGVERLQLRWFAWALCFVVLGFMSWSFEPANPVLQIPLMFIPNLIPIAVGIAITRHGLYSIDRVISRTVSYALVTAVVVGTYAVVVTSVSRLLPDSDALPVAGATLAAAGVCLPVLRRVRGWVDRRFDRARFDAQQQVEAFAARMGAVVDADDVTADLAGTVQQTLAPSSVVVWVGGAR